MEDYNFGRGRPFSSSPPIGSPMSTGLMDNVAQSYRSNRFRPVSPSNRQVQQSKTSDEPPLLKRHKVDFTPDEPITHLAAGNSQICFATKDMTIQTIDTRSNKQSLCNIARYLGNRLSQSKVYRLFLDPTGKFLLISLAFEADNQPMDNLLFVKQVQPLPRLKNHLISAVAWNHPKSGQSITGSTNNSTGTILLGTTKGLVFQTEFIHSDETKFFPLTPGPRQYVKEVFDIGPEAGAITGLEYHQISNNLPNEKSFVILVSTSSRLYRMVGNVPSNVDPPPLHLIFAQNSTRYKDVPGKFTNSRLDLYYPSKPDSPPSRFAWLTEPGVMTSELYTQLTACKSSFESNEDINIISYTNPDEVVLPPSFSSLVASTPSGMSPPLSPMAVYYQDKPISMVVTNFHVIVLFRHCIRAICVLNNLTVHEEYFPTNYGKVQGMSKDPIKNFIWVYCNRAILRYKISNENKNVWKIFLDQKRFDLAKRYSSGDPINYDRVVCEEAQHYFRLNEFEKSAELFARSKKPFEEVSLTFMEAKCSRALKKYLMIRLDEFDLPAQALQFTMALAWLMEIIISSISVKQLQSETDKTTEELDELYIELEQLFDNKQVLSCIKRQKSLFYGILNNYSNQATFIRVAELIGDYEKIVQSYIDSGEFDQATEIIRKVKRDDLIQKYGHILMKRKPKELVDVLIEQQTIQPVRLIAVLIQENPYFNKCSETIRYLEHCIRTLKTDSKIVYNYLFELYARHRDEDTLLSYLEDIIPSDGTQQYYLDLQLCLRLCNELKLIKVCVVLYSYMGLYDEAVNLALGLDVELAKSIAKKVDSEDHQKRLWLLIAGNVLGKNADIKVATGLLSESRLLRIEDILPFFPDYRTIDYFRDAIRQALCGYRNQIMNLKDGTYDNIADNIRGEIKAFRNRYSIIKVGQKCEICSKNIMARTFYVFPCGHLFHRDCILKEIMIIDPKITLDNTSSKSIGVDECIYCGGLLASYIDKPAPVGDDPTLSDLS